MGGKQSKKSTTETSSTAERPERQGKTGFSFRIGRSSKKRTKSKREDEDFNRDDQKRTSGFSRFMKRYATIQKPKEEQRKHVDQVAQAAEKRQQENIPPKKPLKPRSVTSDMNNRTFDTEIQSVADETRSQKSTRSNTRPQKEKKSIPKMSSYETDRLSDEEISVVFRDKSHNTTMESEPSEMRRATRMIERQSKIMPKEIISQLKNRQTMSVTTSNMSRESSVEYLDSDPQEQPPVMVQRPKKTHYAKVQKSKNEDLEMPSLESDPGTPPIPKKRSTANLPKQDQIVRAQKNSTFTGASSSDLASGTSGTSGAEDDYPEPENGKRKQKAKAYAVSNTKGSKVQQSAEYKRTPGGEIRENENNIGPDNKNKNISTTNAQERREQNEVEMRKAVKPVSTEQHDSTVQDSRHRAPKRKPARESLKRKSLDLSNSFENANLTKPIKDESLGAIPKNSKIFLPQTAEQLDEEIANSVGPYYQRQYFPAEKQVQNYPAVNNKNIVANGSFDAESSDSSLRETKGRVFNNKFQKKNVLSTHDQLIKSCPEEITILKYHSFKDGINIRNIPSDEDRNSSDSDEESHQSQTMNASFGKVTDV